MQMVRDYVIFEIGKYICLSGNGAIKFRINSNILLRSLSHKIKNQKSTTYFFYFTTPMCTYNLPHLLLHCEKLTYRLFLPKRLPYIF